MGVNSANVPQKALKSGASAVIVDVHASDVRVKVGQPVFVAANILSGELKVRSSSFTYLVSTLVYTSTKLLCSCYRICEAGPLSTKLIFVRCV